MMNMPNNKIDDEIIEDVLENISDVNVHRAMQYQFDMIKRLLSRISILEAQNMAQKKIINISKSGPKKNSTKEEIDTKIYTICEIIKEGNDYLLLHGNELEDVIEAFVLEGKDMKKLKLDSENNKISISNTIIRKISVLKKEKSGWSYTYTECPEINKESYSNEEIDNICELCDINISSRVKKKETKINKIKSFYNKRISDINIFNLKPGLIDIFLSDIESKSDKKIVNIIEINVINTSYFKSEKNIKVDFTNGNVYNNTKLIGKLVLCDNETNAFIIYGGKKYLCMVRHIYNDTEYIICILSGYVILFSDYLKKKSNIAKYKLYEVNESKNMFSIGKNGLCFKSGNTPYIISEVGEIIDVNNSNHIKDIYPISENLYQVYKNGILMEYCISWDRTNWGVNYTFIIDPLNDVICPKQVMTIQSKYLNGNEFLMENSNQGKLLRVAKENSYITINDIHYIIGTKLTYNDEYWYVCSFTGKSIKEDDYDISEDNIVNSQLYLLKNHNLTINTFGIEFNDESENVIITKEINLNKKSYIVEVYDTKDNLKYKTKNGVII